MSQGLRFLGPGGSFLLPSEWLRRQVHRPGQSGVLGRTMWTIRGSPPSAAGLWAAVHEIILRRRWRSGC